MDLKMLKARLLSAAKRVASTAFVDGKFCGAKVHQQKLDARDAFLAILNATFAEIENEVRRLNEQKFGAAELFAFGLLQERTKLKDMIITRLQAQNDRQAETIRQVQKAVQVG